jgi:lipoprotein signal peptidase
VTISLIDFEKKDGRLNKESFVFLFVILIIADQLIKYFIPDEKYFLNHNFAFSLPVPGYLMYLVYFFILGGIGHYLFKNFYQLDRISKIAWSMILAGAASNIGERIALGYVRDFIYINLHNWTGIYNVADGYIIVGVVILITKLKD